MTTSSVVSGVPQYQVFLNFRGQELRHKFVSHLEKAMRNKNINLFIDEKAAKGEHLNILLEEIEKSRIALVIFSKRYTESSWCLNELVKIRERMDKEKLVTIPIFYIVDTNTVKHQLGQFGDAMRKKTREDDSDKEGEWVAALSSVCDRIGFTFDGKRNENEFIDVIVQEVLKELKKISLTENINNRSLDYSQDTEVATGEAETEFFGLKQRLSDLEEMVDIKNKTETRVVGVVGMHGIGKTNLVKKFFENSKTHFVDSCILEDINEIVKSSSAISLSGMLLTGLFPDDSIEEETYEANKKRLLENRVFIVLDGISEKKQIEELLKGHREWTKKGSKIVIATNDRSLLEGFVQGVDTYEVPPLNYRDSLKHFDRYAFSQKNNEDKEAFMKVSKEFVHNTGGHPLALEVLGEELRGKSLASWKEKLETLSPSIRDRVLKVSYDELNPELKDAFLDIACFRSHDLVYVTSILDSCGPEATIIKALKDKFLISTCDNSRVQMHDLLYTFATEFCSETNGSRRHQRDVNTVLRKQKGNNNVKVIGIFLDLSEIKGEMTVGPTHFKKMRELRYLKLYSSHCPQECKPLDKIRIPEELDFPLEEVRCLHWLKYPLEELPPKFNPKNLVDLKLPYSEIEQIWKDKVCLFTNHLDSSLSFGQHWLNLLLSQDAPKLKWVDLSHSKKLNTLSGISKAQNLQRLNLEGCTALETMDPDMQHMTSLVYLNLKGCTSLVSLPDIKLESLKTLDLRNCSSLESFLVISEVLEVLYLDGTAITELPTTMVKLVKLSMRDCKDLKKLPEDFDKLKVLRELVCSDCSKLISLPDVMKNMKFLQILLLDGTAITEIPHIFSLERLCLSKMEKIISLPDNISQFFQLKWLDLKYCKKLSSIPELPPNLNCLDAHGCVSLKTVGNPVVTHLPMEQIHSTFIFTNCNELGRTAKKEITTYAQRKCQMLSDALKRCNEGFVPEVLFSTCYPGCEVPSWFCHKSVGSVLKPKLPAHWTENKFVGVALCAVVSFPNYGEQVNSFSVTCKFELKGKDGWPISFNRLVGRWNEHGNELDKKTSDHVFICFTRCSNNIKCLEDQHSGTCIPITASLEFDVTDEKDKLEVLKCGLSLVYASDEPQKTNIDVTATKDINDAEFYKCPQIEIQDLTPTRMSRNDSLNSKGSENLSPSGEVSSVTYADSQSGR